MNWNLLSRIGWWTEVHRNHWTNLRIEKKINTINKNKYVVPVFRFDTYCWIHLSVFFRHLFLKNWTEKCSSQCYCPLFTILHIINDEARGVLLFLHAPNEKTHDIDILIICYNRFHVANVLHFSSIFSRNCLNIHSNCIFYKVFQWF